jgi:hypothetical protein
MARWRGATATSHRVVCSGSVCAVHLANEGVIQPIVAPELCRTPAARGAVVVLVAGEVVVAMAKVCWQQIEPLAVQAEPAAVARASSIAACAIEAAAQIIGAVPLLRLRRRPGRNETSQQRCHLGHMTHHGSDAGVRYSLMIKSRELDHRSSSAPVPKLLGGVAPLPAGGCPARSQLPAGSKALAPRRLALLLAHLLREACCLGCYMYAVDRSPAAPARARAPRRAAAPAGDSTISPFLFFFKQIEASKVTASNNMTPLGMCDKLIALIYNRPPMGHCARRASRN